MMTKSSANDIIGAQEKVLKKILKVNAHCEFGVKYAFSSIKDIATFREKVPLTTYKYVYPLIDGVMKGYQKLNTADKVVEVVREVVDGEERYFPVTDTLKLDMKSINVMLDFLRRRTRKHDQSRSALIDIQSPGGATEGGVPIRDMDSFLTSYISASLIPDECYDLPTDSQYYAHALVALSENQIKSLEFSSIEVMENFFQVIIEHQMQLSIDLRRNHANKEMFSERMRSLIDGRLVAKKGRHLELKRAIETGEEHLALKMWMTLKYVTVR